MNNKDENEISVFKIKLKELTNKRQDILIRLKRVEKLKRETGRRNQVVEEQYQRELNEINNQIEIVEAEFEKETLKQKQQFEDILEKERQAREVESKRLEGRAKSIQAYCTEREIKKLIHFTRTNNLKSILNNGLLGRNALERLSSTEIPIFNDAHRFDGYPEAICLSISYPNYQMFYKYRSGTNAKEWVILILESCILWQFDCAFFERNAASNSAKNVPLPLRKEYPYLERMFKDYLMNNRQDLDIPDNYTTNPQAEVLVLEPIASQYIVEVHFYYKLAMENWLSENGRNYSQRFVVNSEYFEKRSDWEKWQQNDNKVLPF